jgi:hypothetical protein
MCSTRGYDVMVVPDLSGDYRTVQRFPINSDFHAYCSRNCSYLTSFLPVRQFEMYIARQCVCRRQDHRGVSSCPELVSIPRPYLVGTFLFCTNRGEE